LDYTGSALYPASLLRGHAELLDGAILGNPHSESPASVRATALMDAAREAVLGFFGAESGDYDVVFTANASAAAKLVGESFPFTSHSRLVLPADNHNSVNGIREFARASGASVRYLPLDEELRLAASPLEALFDEPARHAQSLFGYPAQSTFSGVRHPMALIARAQASGYRVLLDAAAFAPTVPLNLSDVKPDFVCISFYKMFGWPTGLGALVARREALAELRRPWFAGGTVEFASVQHARHRLLGGVEGFEDGTPNFLAAAAVPNGLSFLAEIGMERFSRRMTELTARLLERLGPMARIYGPTGVESRGATVAFNLVDRDGQLVPYWRVERAAARASISLRGGCFCNPGASEAAFGIDASASARCMDALGPGVFNPERFSACMGGAPVGAVRASLGLPTIDADLTRLVSFLDHLREEPEHDAGLLEPHRPDRRRDPARGLAPT
jgi:selenocysteine lyase/cysteine desulfurase